MQLFKSEILEKKMRSILGHTGFFLHIQKEHLKLHFMCFCVFFDVVIEVERTTKQRWFCDSEVPDQTVITALI